MSHKFQNQFVIAGEGIAEQVRPLTGEFRETKSSGLTVFHCPSVPVRTIRVSNDDSLLVLGWMFDANGLEVVAGSFRGMAFSAGLVRERCFGRFLLVHCRGDGQTVLTDPAATLSAFIATDQDVIVSTELLASESRMHLEECEELRQCDDLCRSSKGYWYPMGMGRYKNLRLLLPNHATDLKTKKSTRIWPTRDTLRQPALDVSEIADHVSDLCVFLKSAASLGKLVLPLTSGRDSRTLLAGVLAADLEDQLVLYSDGPRDHVDVRCAKTLSDAYLIPWADGNSVHGVCITGFGGEIVKGYWDRNLPLHGVWRDRVRTAIPFGNLVSACSVVAEHLERWLDEALSLFEESDPRVLDLAYLELRWAATMGQVNYEKDRRHGLTLAPFSHPRMIETGFRLPDKVRTRMSVWELFCLKIDPRLTILPAGIPHFSTREKPLKILQLMYGWALSRTSRTMIYSGYYFSSLFRRKRILGSSPRSRQSPGNTVSEIS